MSRRPMRLSSWIQQYSLMYLLARTHSLVAAAVLLHIWNLPNEMIPEQSCCSERCCSRSGIHSCPVAAMLVQMWHILNFLHDSSWFSSPQSLRSQVSLLRFHQQDFFLSSYQSGHFWNLITQFYIWFLAHQRGSVLGYSNSLLSMYLISLRLVSEQTGMICFSSTS